MQAQTMLVAKPSRPAGAQILRVLFGLLLFLAPAGFCVISLFLPSLGTLLMSLQDIRLLSEEAEFIGMLNYTQLFSTPAFSQALLFTLLLTMARLVIVAVIPPVLGYAVGRLGRGVRWAARVLFSVALVIYAPVAIGLAWRLVLSPASNLFSGSPLADPEIARLAFLLVDSLYTAGLACGVGLVFYLAAMRAVHDPGAPWMRRAGPLIVLWLLSILATIAFSLQDFTLSFTLTGGGPANLTATLALLEFRQAFQMLNLGMSTALASLLLLALMGLGLIAGLVIVFSGVRLSLARPEGKSSPGNQSRSAIILPILLLVLSLVCILPACVLSLLPLPWSVITEMGAEATGEIAQNIPLTRLLSNTFLPLLGAVFLIQLPIAFVGALGIGGLRPLGRWSEILLLPFTPWLFVTMVPLGIFTFIGFRESGVWNTIGALAPPLWLNVPMLVILTLFFKGQTAAWQEAASSLRSTAHSAGEGSVGAFFRKLILPALPLALALGAAALFAGAQSLFWPLIAVSRAELFTLTLALTRVGAQFFGAGPLVTREIIRLMLPVSGAFFVIFALLQVFYLDRLALTNHDER